MSWQLASMLIVLGCLALAFWWYERSQPPAGLIALVGTLAALAALGRDAFAAIPDVKPITAIVLVSGIALGAGPGFMIGAIAGLASNVLLGQGPWTPWQMLGWGLVGAVGGGLGRIGARRWRAPALALAAAASAELFNLLVDLYTWTGTGSHSLAGYGVVLGSALSFDLTHVVASFVFALAFGRVLLAMLARARGRLQVTWVPADARLLSAGGPLLAISGGGGGGGSGPAGRGDGTPPAARRGRRRGLLLGLLLVVVAAAGVGVALADTGGSKGASGTRAAAAKASLAPEIAYLKRAQDPDGGFGASVGQPSSELYTAWVAIGMAAAGRPCASVRRDGHDPLDALRSEAGTLEGAGDLERTILALRACGASVRSFPGGDLVKRLLARRAHNGSFESLSNLTAFAILALRAAGEGPGQADVKTAAAWLQRQQEPDGGFGFATRGGGSDVDDTGAVLQALVAAGRRDRTVISRAAAYLVRAENRDGGFPQEQGGSSNAQSTAFALQGLIAIDAHTGAGPGPVAYLRSLRQANGSIRYSRSGSQTPVWVTAQALAALAGRALPIVGR